MVSVVGREGFNEPLRSDVDWIEAAMPVIAIFGRSFDFANSHWSRDSSIDFGLPLRSAKLVVPLVFSVFCLRTVL